MSTLQPTSREDINEFLEAGHQQFVGTEERVQIIQHILGRKRHVELGLSDLAISDRRRPVRIESDSPRRSLRLAANPSTRIARGGFFDDRRRLTGRAKELVTKPQMKLGIFNNFCKSKNVKLRTFDEAELDEFEPIKVAEPDHEAEGRRLKERQVVKPIQELTSDGTYYPVRPVRELSVIESSSHEEGSEVTFHNEEGSGTTSDYSQSFFLDMCSEIDSIVGLRSSDDSACSDEFSSASSSSLSSSIL